MRICFSKISFLLLLILLSFSSFAQDSTKTKKRLFNESFRDKIFTGGNIGLQFGTITFIEVSPLIGYRFTNKIWAGIGATYQYYRYNDLYYALETNVYGGRLFGRYFFTNNLFAHVEYEYLNLEAFDFQRRRVDVTSILGGIGYIQRFGLNSGITAMLLYNFTESYYTPYTNPIFRIGINIGF